MTVYNIILDLGLQLTKITKAFKIWFQRSDFCYFYTKLNLDKGIEILPEKTSIFDDFSLCF